VQSTSDKQEELDTFLEQISPSLRMKVQCEIFTVSIRKNSVIKVAIELI